MASAALTKGALWMQNVDYPASWDRALIDALYPSEGVIDGFAVTANGGLSIAVSGGRAIVQGDEVANQGKYLVDQDATTTLTVASVGTTRTEYVYIAVNDTAVAGGRAGNNVSIETSTTAPPDSALLLATLFLTSGTATITGGMIADGRVYAALVPDGSVTTAKLANSSVTSAKIVDGTIATADIANGAVATAKIADEAVIAAKIGLGAVGEYQIAAGAVSYFKLETELANWLSAMDPADAITAIAGSTAPTGWVLCDGAAYPRATYPATFGRIGTTYGAGDGSTTFNVPDLRNRFIAGKGTAAWSDTLNEANDPSRKDAIIPIHGHTASTATDGGVDHLHVTGSLATNGGGTHVHDEGGYDNVANAGFLFRGGAGANGWETLNGSGTITKGYQYPQVQASGSAHNHTIIGNTGAADRSLNHAHAVTVATATGGASVTDANLPPYRTLNYCIRMR